MCTTKFSSGLLATMVSHGWWTCLNFVHVHDVFLFKNLSCGVADMKLQCNPSITTILGPEGVRYSEKFGTENSSFPMDSMHYNNIHSHFTWFSGFVILSLR